MVVRRGFGREGKGVEERKGVWKRAGGGKKKKKKGRFLSTMYYCLLAY